MPPENTQPIQQPSQVPPPPPPQPTPPAPNYPNGLIGMTGSQLQPEKTSLPKGIYVLTALSVLSFGVSFFDTSNNSLIYTIDMLLLLLLTFGLYFRLDAARKLLMWLSALTIVGSIIAIIGFMGLQSRANQIEQRSDAAFAQLEGRPMTENTRKQLDALKKQMNDLEKQFGKSMPFVYGKYALTIVLYTGVVVYLSRPRVKEAFRSDFA